MKKYLNLFLATVIICGLVGCNREVTCPAFKEEVLSWTPYQENDVIELYSPMNDSTIIFSIKSVDVTHTTHYNTGYDCGTCDDAITITQNDYDNFRFHIDISLNKNQIKYQSYYIGDTYFVDGNYTYSEQMDFSFEGKKYDVVMLFEKKDSNGTIKKIIIAKDIGIVGIVDIYGNIWTLKDKVQIRGFSNERKNVKITNVSCD